MQRNGPCGREPGQAGHGCEGRRGGGGVRVITRKGARGRRLGLPPPVPGSRVAWAQRVRRAHPRPDDARALHVGPL